MAKDNGKLVGSIGLMNYGDGIGILKKFFVYEEYRGVKDCDFFILNSSQARARIL